MSGICAPATQSQHWLQPEGWSTRAGVAERQYHGERHDAGQRSATLVVLSQQGKTLHLEGQQRRQRIAVIELSR